VTEISEVSAMVLMAAAAPVGLPIHRRDERQSWGDHRSSATCGPREHVVVQDRNFVRAFTSDYRVMQSPSTPGPGVFGSNPSGEAVHCHRLPHRAQHHRGDVSVTKPPHAGSEDPPARLRSIPEASVARLAVYLRKLGELAEEGADTVSSDELAAATGVNPAKLRKDLSYIGSYGIRGVGYEVSALVHQLERTLGLNHRQAVALVGIGNLGHALAGYGGFGGRGFPVTALFDVDPDLVGIHINGILVEHVRAIPEVCAQRGVTIGMIATPAQGAQSVCDLFVEAGVRCILNFAPVVLQVPEEVEVRKVDLAVELQILAFHVARKHVAAVGQATAVNGHPVNGAGRLLS
jgi:redox-sensing transcriptional repressor